MLWLTQILSNNLRTHEPNPAENDVDISPSEETMWTKNAAGIDFNDYATFDEELPICTTKEN